MVGNVLPAEVHTFASDECSNTLHKWDSPELERESLFVVYDVSAVEHLEDRLFQVVKLKRVC